MVTSSSEALNAVLAGVQEQAGLYPSAQTCTVISERAQGATTAELPQSASGAG